MSGLAKFQRAMLLVFPEDSGKFLFELVEAALEVVRTFDARLLISCGENRIFEMESILLSLRKRKPRSPVVQICSIEGNGEGAFEKGIIREAQRYHVDLLLLHSGTFREHRKILQNSGISFFIIQDELNKLTKHAA